MNDPANFQSLDVAPIIAAGADSSGPRLRRIARLAAKELREIVRDRRTIVTLIAMPLLLYPLMSVAFQQIFLVSKVTPDAGQEYRVGFITNIEEQAFYRRYDQGRRALRIMHRQADAAAKEVKPAGDMKQPGKPKAISQIIPEVWHEKPRNEAERAAALAALKEQLQAGSLDLVVVIPQVDAAEATREVPVRDHFLPCQMYYAPNAPISLSALSYFKTIFAAVNEWNLKDRLNVPDAKYRFLLVSPQPIPVQGTGGDGMIPLSALVPLILILMTITGAVYPAIDLTAGERERGTLEILVAAPVSRLELLAAKYFTVVTFAVLNAVVNLVCMAATVSWSGLGPSLIREGELSWTLFVQVLALLLMFAAFFSAVLLCLTSFAAASRKPRLISFRSCLRRWPRGSWQCCRGWSCRAFCRCCRW